MAVDGTQAKAHRDHRDMGTTCPAPAIDLRLEAVDTAPRKHQGLPAEVFYRPA